MAKTDFKSVDQYIKAQPPHARPILQRVREVIARALPRAVEGISYQIPVFKMPAGPAVIYFAAWKAHYSLYPASAALVAALEGERAPFTVEKATVKFPLDAPVPAGLITRIAKMRAREVADAKAVKGGAPKKRR
ncbi:MAG TPA: DUF1801 domain-containing protein [Vicinamibacteria bacterium]|nr:DUF1801 domain-containing protein [Vicinamibacteria bacterium]